MIQRAVSADHADKINRILIHPGIWNSIADDFSGEPQDYDCYEIIQKGEDVAIILSDFETIAFIVHRVNGITWEGHFAITPEKRKVKFLLQEAEEALNYIFEKTSCRKLIGFIPEDNKAGLLFLRECGFKVEGNCTKSILQDRILKDRVLVGLNKKDWRKEATTNGS